MCSWCVRCSQTSVSRFSSAGLLRVCNGRLFVPVWESLWGETAARRSRRAWKCSSPRTPDNTPETATAPANTTYSCSNHRLTLLETHEEYSSPVPQTTAAAARDLVSSSASVETKPVAANTDTTENTAERNTAALSYSSGAQPCSWRSTFLQSSAPPMIKHTWTNELGSEGALDNCRQVCLIRVGAELCEGWTPLSYSNKAHQRKTEKSVNKLKPYKSHTVLYITSQREEMGFKIWLELR